MGALATDARWQGFVCGFAGACTAELVTSPLDLVKTRLQLATELGRAPPRAGYAAGWLGALRAVARDEGVAELYRGLRPALLRQASYGTLRVGTYEPAKAALERAGVAPGLPLKLLAGMACGGAAAGLCCPTDVAKVRMQADGLAGRRRYAGALHALRSIYAAEGLRGLYGGAVPTMQRAAIVAAVELASYDEIKERLVRSRLALLGAGDAATHLLAAVCAGFLSALAASPADVLKSRLMHQPRDARTGRGLRYASTLDCLRQSVRAEGVRALWKGLWPSFARSGPHCIVNFLVIEQLRSRFFSVAPATA
jgi:hypothetical protein